MRRYETTFVVNPQADDAAIDRQVTAVADLIKTDGGKILNERRIGTRRLAYPILDLVQGFYATIVFDAENTVLPKLERHFKLEEPYVRYLTIRYDGPLPSDEVETAPVAAGEKAESKPAKEVKEAEKTDKPDAEAPAEKVETEAKVDPAPAVEKPATEEPAAPAPAVEESAPEAPKAVEPPAPAEQPKPADPADEEL